MSPLQKSEQWQPLPFFIYSDNYLGSVVGWQVLEGCASMNKMGFFCLIKSTE